MRACARYTGISRVIAKSPSSNRISALPLFRRILNLISASFRKSKATMARSYAPWKVGSGLRVLARYAGEPKQCGLRIYFHLASG